MPHPVLRSEISEALSTLIHGADELAVASVAVAIALRAGQSFVWVDCADRHRSTGQFAHQILGRGAEHPVVDRVDDALLRTPRWTRESLERVFVPSEPGLEGRFASYLKIPELFQRMIAQVSSADGRGVIVLANVDAIPSASRSRAFEPREIHNAIHEQGVSLFATSRDRPTTGLVGAFDRVLRVDVPAPGRWTDGCLTVEKGELPQLTVDPAPLWKAWELLGLDPTLLPS